MQNKNNLACRIFKEQIDLIQQLPEKERAEVLYKAILSALNQIENQNDNQIDNQIENQNENAYVSVSVSDSISVLSKTVYSLLRKNIVFKEFSNNYGGTRTGAGRPKKPDVENMNKISIKYGTDTEREREEEELQPLTAKTTKKEFLTWAEQMDSCAGMGGFANTKDQREMFWNHFEAQGWRRKNGMPAVNVKALFKIWVDSDKQKKEQEDDIPTAPKYI